MGDTGSRQDPRREGGNGKTQAYSAQGQIIKSPTLEKWNTLVVKSSISPQERQAEEEEKELQQREHDILGPFLIQLGNPVTLEPEVGKTLVKMCLQDYKTRLNEYAQLIQEFCEKVKHSWSMYKPFVFIPHKLLSLPHCGDLKQIIFCPFLNK